MDMNGSINIWLLLHYLCRDVVLPLLDPSACVSASFEALTGVSAAAGVLTAPGLGGSRWLKFKVSNKNCLKKVL